MQPHLRAKNKNEFLSTLQHVPTLAETRDQMSLLVGRNQGFINICQRLSFLHDPYLGGMSSGYRRCDRCNEPTSWCNYFFLLLGLRMDLLGLLQILLGLVVLGAQIGYGAAQGKKATQACCVRDSFSGFNSLVHPMARFLQP